MSEDPTPLVERISRFVADPAAGSFDELAFAAFAFGYRRIAPYRRLCDERGATPGTVGDPRRVPALPAAAFKTLEITTADDDDATALTFRSSGTTRGATEGSTEGRAGTTTQTGDGDRAVHRHPFPDLYRATLDAAFPAFCPLAAARPAILALVPTRQQSPDSSLAFMVDHLMARFGGEGSAYAFGPRGVDARALRSWCGARQRGGRPVLVLATSFALADALDALDRFGLRFRLPSGSAAMDTGGYKGRRRELARPELAARLHDLVGVGPRRLFSEYGMTELTSQLYTRNLVDDGAAGDLYAAPHWVRVQVLDAKTLDECAAGETGLVAVYDLANLGSAAHLLTEDLGRVEDGGLRLMGRAAGADLRGCSLVVEELGG